MKKVLALCILTALCMTCLVGCDMGNGLIAELFGDLSNPPTYDVEDIPTLDVIMGTELKTEAPIEDPIPPIEQPTWVVTEPPIEYPSWDDTVESDVDIALPDVIYPTDELILDGDLSDWDALGFVTTFFDANNLDAWYGEVGNDNGFTLRMASDNRYVYFAFDVTDYELLYSDDDTYNGDAFQIQIDFNGWVASSQAFDRAVFYSFGLQRDGTMNVTVQCIRDDSASSIDYKMASDDDSDWREGEIIGVTCVKSDDTGWTAEFAISWETLYGDVAEKLESVEENMPGINLGYDSVDLNMLICYIDREKTEDGVIGAWGTSNAMGALASGEGWYPENAGVIAFLNPADTVSCYIGTLM